MRWEKSSWRRSGSSYAVISKPGSKPGPLSWKVIMENALWRVQPSATFLDLLVYDGSGIMQAIY